MQERKAPQAWRTRRLRLVLTVGLTLALGACGGGTGSDSVPQSSAAGTGGNRVEAMAAQEAPSGLVITALTKVSETRVDRTNFDFAFKVSVRNPGNTAYGNVTATLTTVAAGASIIDGSASLGTVAAGATVVSSDTVTIRQDRTKPFDASALVWRFEGSSGSTPQAQIAALEDSGAIPKLERGNTLQGTDADADGVRDDVAAYINGQFTAPAQKAAAVQAAKSLQAALLVAPGDTTAAKAASLRIANAVNCIYARFPMTGSTPPGKVVTDLEAVITNTKQRLLAYLAYNKALDGTTSGLPQGDTCE